MILYGAVCTCTGADDFINRALCLAFITTGMVTEIQGFDFSFG